MNKLRIVIPKGRIFENVVKLLNEAGIYMQVNERGYRPIVNNPEIEIKIMKPQNIPKLVELGSHDIGFTGYDWIVETGADIAEIMDLKLNPVKIIAAVPQNLSDKSLRTKKLVVASEYENMATSFLKKGRYNYVFLRTYGTTEVFPPDDADMIIDNTATGRTLTEHNLRTIATLLNSSTRFIANKKSLKDAWKREKIDEMKILFQSVLDARERVMLEMNIPKEKFKSIVKILPCMRSPTVAPLYGEQGFAVKVAVKRTEVIKLIPLLKKLGATDILEYEFRKVVV
ncbi:MAG: ATP phosphoribosyltransferase [Planctomycetota bacterium]